MMKSRFFVAALFLPALQAAATTPAEEALTKAPMPHVLLDANGPKVVVHRARLHGFLLGKDDKAALAQLKAGVQRCVKGLNGGAGKPPTAWPDYVISNREDMYIAANRSIRYSYGIAYVLHPTNCSLLEGKTARASLTSALGHCSIDLLEKTAIGKCGKDGHAGAPEPVRSAPTSPAQAITQALKSGVSPQVAAALKQTLAMAGGPTGEKKTILGLSCDVWTMPMTIMPGTFCLATGGAKFPVNAGTYSGQEILNLESQTGQIVTATAIEAQLDDSVPAAVFAPHLAAGFTINPAKKP